MQLPDMTDEEKRRHAEELARIKSEIAESTMPPQTEHYSAPRMNRHQRRAQDAKLRAYFKQRSKQLDKAAASE